MRDYLDPMRVYSFIFALAWIPFWLFLAVHEWRGVVVTTSLLVGMAFVLGYEASTRHNED